MLVVVLQLVGSNAICFSQSLEAMWKAMLATGPFFVSIVYAPASSSKVHNLSLITIVVARAS